MFGNIIVRTKFLPPYYKSKIFSRKHLKNIFDKTAQYPVTMVKAGPGYGKSAYLTYGFSDKDNVFWYNVSKGDGDVLTFLINLIYAFNTTDSDIGEKTLNFIKEKGETNQEWIPVLNSLINEIWDKYRYQEIYLIIDDYHLLNNQPQINKLMEHFIDHRLPNMHLVISSRKTPDLTSLSMWRVKDQILEINEDNLKLSKKEIKKFYNKHYDYNLNDEDITLIYELTEGWIIGVEMIRQGIKDGDSLEVVRDKSMHSLEHLFNYLAKEILLKQNEEVRKFLIKTSILRVLTPEVCDYVRAKDNSDQILKYLVKNDLFIIQLDDNKYRYHHLFHDFLKEQAKEELNNISLLQKDIAKYYMDNEQFEEAVYHNLESGDYFTAAKIIKERANKLLTSGRFSTYNKWFEKLPERITENFPRLYLYKGDIERFTCNYNQALNWYNLGRKYLKEQDDYKGISVAFQKMAMIYLDTVQPSEADKYLKKALELREKENYWEESVLLRLVAENYLNRGNVAKAKEMQEKLNKLDEENTSFILDSRVKIRTGRLKEAEKLLKNELKKEDIENNKNVGRAHRETILLLSLIASFEGKNRKALEYAKTGLKKSKNIDSLFTQAVAHMRLGHALQINGSSQQEMAIKAYEESLEIVDRLEVRRGRAEALWGLTLVYGNLGYEEQMKKYGLEGIKICEEAGDEWLGSLIQLSLGIGYVFLKDYKAATEWLTKAVKSFDYCNDIFGKTIGQIWLTLIDCKLEHKVDFKHRFEEIVPIIQENNLHFIFKTINLLGPRGQNVLLPILTTGYNMEIEKEFCKLMLEDLDVELGINHPGYTLKVKTLGKFRLMRGRTEVKDKDWKRKKARTLFKIFITYQDELISKERLAEMISSKKDQKSAIRDFKVALNALNNVLEPNRKARETPYFINKKGSRYGLNPNSSYTVDINHFEGIIKKGIRQAKNDKIVEAIESLNEGIDLYDGNYLPNCLYQDWTREVREKYKQLFIQGLELLAELYLKLDKNQKTIEMAEKLLAEEATIEEAYQLMMKAYNKMGQRSQAIRTYQRCAEKLEKDLGVIPTQKTVELYKEIKKN
ncbi:MAG: BTAD domain-containing putative transcriptional regulator [Halanaerobiales bacterium]